MNSDLQKVLLKDTPHLSTTLFTENVYVPFFFWNNEKPSRVISFVGATLFSAKQSIRPSYLHYNPAATVAPSAVYIENSISSLIANP